jgi:hypothetical protein
MASIVNVPNVPGVPAVLFAPSSGNSISLLSSDGADIPSIFANPQWGIYLNGVPVVVADSVVSLEFKQEFALSDYMVEQGGFDTYDKVYIPFSARVKFTAGSESSRTALLTSISAVIGDLNFYDVVMPEAIYPSVNFKHQDFKRTATSGLGLLSVEVWVEQVNVASGASLTSTQSPSGTAQTNGGTVQPVTPTQSQSALFGLSN